MPHVGEHVTRDVRRHQGHLGSASGRLRGERRTLPAAGAVAEETHGIDRLASAAGRDHHPHAGEVTGSQQRLRGGEDLLGFRHPAGTAVTTGELTVGRTHQVHTALPQGRDVRLCRPVPPHLGVHRRSDQHRGLGREQGGPQKIVGEPGSDLRDRVRGRRRHDHEVGRLTESHVPHPCHILVHARCHGVTTDRLPCRQPDEAQRIRGGHHGHVVAALREQAHEMHRLVRGDAACDSDHDVHVSILPQHPPPRADDRPADLDLMPCARS